MQPSPAEVARTIAAGHLPASAYVACSPGPFPVRHVTDHVGRILLLSPERGALSAALRPADGAAYVRRRLGPAAQPAQEPRVVRVDRSGLLVRLDDRVARLAFSRPVTDRQDLANLLHPALCHRCAG